MYVFIIVISIKKVRYLELPSLLVCSYCILFSTIMLETAAEVCFQGCISFYEHILYLP